MKAGWLVNKWLWSDFDLVSDLHADWQWWLSEDDYSASADQVATSPNMSVVLIGCCVVTSLSCMHWNDHDHYDTAIVLLTRNLQ